MFFRIKQFVLKVVWKMNVILITSLCNKKGRCSDTYIYFYTHCIFCVFRSMHLSSFSFICYICRVSCCVFIFFMIYDYLCFIFMLYFFMFIHFFMFIIFFFYDHLFFYALIFCKTMYILHSLLFCFSFFCIWSARSQIHVID